MLKMIKNCKAYQCIMLRFWDAQVLNAHMASKSSCQQTGQLIYSLLTLKVEQTPTAESTSFHTKRCGA